MSDHKYTDVVCWTIAAAVLVMAILFVNGGSIGIEAAASEMPYADRLFSYDKVHTIDIIVDEDTWSLMLENAREEEYIECSVRIDGYIVDNVGLRTKGNSSLSQAAGGRYSFKVEFDHYIKGQSYYGLDKLVLNSGFQDDTYFKDFISYDMMNKAGADAPLCSFIFITVNSEDWGLYLAVEAIEDSFAKRVYGLDHGSIYKPDNLGLNGLDDPLPAGGPQDDISRGANDIRTPSIMQIKQWLLENDVGLDSDEIDGLLSKLDDASSPAEIQKILSDAGVRISDVMAAGPAADKNEDRMGRGGIFQPDGSDTARNGDTSLMYIDDEYESYGSIFENAVFDISDNDKDRLIESIKRLGEGTDMSSVVDIDEVISYFAVHNFTLNADSYTGTMTHNYYLYEKDGVMSMIAWDYNLAFGAFSTGSSYDAATLVNYPVDDPLLNGDMASLPMISWIFSDDENLESYHSCLDRFISEYFESGYFRKLMEDMTEMISPYVKRDPTAFCSYEEFLEASDMLMEFCLLRAESIRGQLDGSIPSTEEGQRENISVLIDVSGISIEVMGSIGREGGGIFQTPFADRQEERPFARP